MAKRDNTKIVNILGIMFIIVLLIILMYGIFTRGTGGLNGFTQAKQESMLGGIVCNKPYILVGNECCLDENGDNICDKDKPITTSILTTIAPLPATSISIVETSTTIGLQESKKNEITISENEYIILNDRNCSLCKTSEIIKAIKALLPEFEYRLIDISEQEGMRLIKELDIRVVPAYIFNDSVTKSKPWSDQRIRSSFEKKGNYYKLIDKTTGATHFVSEETRKAYYDALGVKKGDNKPQIDFFVMSFCPYGNQAEELVETVYQVLKDKAYFNPHYVIYDNYGGGGPQFCIDNGNYCSMHGIQELNQDIRELCVNKYYGTRTWFKFVLAINKQCNVQNADSCWESVAKKIDIDVQRIKTCQNEEGTSLVAKDKKLEYKFGIAGSPTVFIEGEEYTGSRTASGYLAALCDGFETKPKECEGIIVEQEATTTITSSETKTWHKIVTLIGSSSKSTESFYIPGNKWRFKWSCVSDTEFDIDAGLMSIFVYPEGESVMYVGTSIMGKCTSSETSYVYEGEKNYYFNINTANLDSWKIEVESYH